MKEKKFLSIRKWLNPKDSADSGMVTAHVTASYGIVDSSLTIWDCARKITLDFGFYDEKAAVQRAQKLDLLIDTLQQMKAQMGVAFEECSPEKQQDLVYHILDDDEGLE